MTAAPGPQQPDEIVGGVNLSEIERRWAAGERTSLVGVIPGLLRVARRPAAPSTQPDEVQVSEADALVFLSALYGLGHAYPRPGQTRQEMSQENVALDRQFVAGHEGEVMNFRKAALTALVALMLAGCGYEAPGDKRYRLCVEAGGDWHDNGWGSQQCDLPDNGHGSASDG